MAATRWLRTKEVFQAALAKAPPTRAAFLDEACAGDGDLRREVESLLAAHDEAAGFLSEPAADSVASPPLVGRQLGPYRVMRQTGQGGMGVVYEAEDTRLGRQVALKLLPPSLIGNAAARARFEREARAASALNHPHICTIHDFGEYDGQPFLVMERMQGATLRQAVSGKPISLERVLELGVQLADALEAAHEAGIVHRDIKPANIFVTDHGEAKLLDFGVAKIALTAGPAGSDPALLTTEEHLTSPGSIIGTVTYMSPEQARGEVLDRRSDLFSLGVVMYEMATGRPPFEGKTHAEIYKAILADTPASPASLNAAIPAALEDIIRKALDKDKALRYQHGSELKADLKRLLRDTGTGRLREPVVAPSRFRPRLRQGSAAIAALVLGTAGLWLARHDRGDPAPTGPKRLAVLPFVNLSGDPGQDYFADGMTEVLTASLAQIRSLKVIARTSASRYKESKTPIREIARELRVDAVVEGSFTRSGDRVRITAELIQAQTESHFWAKSFERELGDILTLQGEIAHAIAEQVEAELTLDERSRLTARRPVAAKAYDAYLHGRFFLDEGSEEALPKALDQFNRALEIQGDYAAPYAGIASYYAILPFRSSLSPAEVFPKARAAAEKSVELDEGLAEAHSSLAYIRAYYEWDWAAAEREFRRALELRPNFADAHFSYSRFLAASGRMEEAIAEIRKAEDLDPRELSLKANTALLFYFQGQYDDALKELLEISKADPELSVARWGIGLSYEQKGMGAEALASLKQATELSKSLNLLASLAHGQARFGQGAEAREALTTLTERSRKSYVPSYYFALVHAGLGEKDRAFEWLERAYQERSTVLAYVRIDPRLAPLRSDPRYADLVRRLGFPS